MSQEPNIINSGLSEACDQRRNDRGGETKDGTTKFVAELVVSDQFSNEEVRSRYTYPKGYKVKGITAQISILKQLFPGIGCANEVLVGQPRPPHTEGWFAIPRWQALAPTYGEATEKVLAKIESKRKFLNCRNGQFGEDHLRQRSKTAKMFQKLSDEQEGCDILVVPAQFGDSLKGRSVRRARQIFMPNEFGLGIFAIGIMLLTHPERLVRRGQLHLDDAGDEFSLRGDGDFSSALAFYYDFGVVKLDAYWHGSTIECHGTASGFVSL